MLTPPHRPDLDAVSLERGPKMLREFHGMRAIAVQTNRVGAKVDVDAVDRSNLAFAHHADRARYRFIRIVHMRVGTLS